MRESLIKLIIYNQNLFKNEENIYLFIGGALFALFLLMPNTASAQRTFQNFEIDFSQGGDGFFLTAAEYGTATAVSAGVAVTGGTGDSFGTVTRVAADADGRVATLSGTTNDMHGFKNDFTMIVPVDGPVRITVGTCQYSGSGVVSVTNSSSESVVTGLSTAAAQCFHGNRATNKNSAVYSGGATTLTISGGGYMPYIAIEKVDASTVDWTYSTGTTGAEGVLPDNETLSTGDDYTIPKNFTLYKEGQTLTAWTDGVNTYNVNTSYVVPDGDKTLTPIFEESYQLEDRLSSTSVTWNFRRDQKAPTVAWEGSGHDNHLWVGQATIGGQSVDVKMDIDANPGKFNNASWTDWCQINSGTTLTIPAVKNMTINVTSMNNQTTSFGGDIGYDGYGTSNNVTYTYTGENSTIAIVIGDGSYFRTVTATYPAPSTVTISPAKEYTTFCSTSALNFTAVTGLEAYAVTGSTTSAITLTQVKKVPASTGLILRKTGSSASYDVPVGDAASLGVTNKLVGVTVDTDFTYGDYILSNGTFVRGTAGTLAAGKAYLPAANIDTSANILTFIFEDGETTGISAVERMNTMNDNVFYNLSGQRVAQPTKGLYIVNGKKVIIK